MKSSSSHLLDAASTSQHDSFREKKKEETPFGCWGTRSKRKKGGENEYVKFEKTALKNEKNRRLFRENLGFLGQKRLKNGQICLKICIKKQKKSILYQ